MEFWLLWGTYLGYAALIYAVIFGLFLVWWLLMKLFNVALDDEDTAGFASFVLVMMLLITGVSAYVRVSSQPKPPAEVMEQAK